MFLLTGGKVGRTPLWKMPSVFTERRDTLWWKHSTVLWKRNVSEDTIQITPFCVGWPEWVHHQNPQSDSIPLSLPQAFRPVLILQIFMEGPLHSRNCFGWAALTLFPWWGLQSLTWQLTSTTAEDWKIRIRHSGKRLSPSFRALKNRASPRCGWMMKELNNAVSPAWPALHGTPF